MVCSSGDSVSGILLVTANQGGFQAGPGAANAGL